MNKTIFIYTNMTQEDKDLLLKDLCSRLPYGVKIRIEHPFLKEEEWHSEILYGLDLQRLCIANTSIRLEEFKPYLFPLSSMTDELWDKEFRGCGITEFTRDSFKYDCETLEFNNNNPDLSNIVKFINQLIKNHFDYRGLIEKGLAIDCTNLNIY